MLTAVSPSDKLSTVTALQIESAETSAVRAFAGRGVYITKFAVGLPPQRLNLIKWKIKVNIWWMSLCGRVKTGGSNKRLYPHTHTYIHKCE